MKLGLVKGHAKKGKYETTWYLVFGKLSSEDFLWEEIAEAGPQYDIGFYVEIETDFRGARNLKGLTKSLSIFEKNIGLVREHVVKMSEVGILPENITIDDQGNGFRIGIKIREPLIQQLLAKVK